MNVNLTLHIKKFNDKLKIMNQSSAKDLTLTAQEARGLHSDIFELLNMVANLSNKSTKTEDKTVQVLMSGGSFK
jgi:uncharacterized protein YfkK (UPF0435 family)